MFQNLYATNFFIMSTVQWGGAHVSPNHSGRVQRLWWTLLGWWGFQTVNLIRDWFYGWYEHCLEVFFDIHHFLIRLFLGGFHLLLFGFNCGFHDDELFIRLVIHIVASFWGIEAWVMTRSIEEIEQWLWLGAIYCTWALMSELPV